MSDRPRRTLRLTVQIRAAKEAHYNFDFVKAINFDRSLQVISALNFEFSQAFSRFFSISILFVNIETIFKDIFLVTRTIPPEFPRLDRFFLNPFLFLSFSLKGSKSVRIPFSDDDIIQNASTMLCKSILLPILESSYWWNSGFSRSQAFTKSSTGSSFTAGRSASKPSA
jgi:hypothetical protein